MLNNSKKFYSLLLVVGISIFASGCSMKEITPEEKSKAHFILPYGYEKTVAELVPRKLVQDYGKQLYGMKYGHATVHPPHEVCSRNFIFKTVSCEYEGQSSIAYVIPALQRQGQPPVVKTYRYTITKDKMLTVHK